MTDLSGREVNIGDLVLLLSGGITRYGLITGEYTHYSYGGEGHHYPSDFYLAAMTEKEQKEKARLLARYQQYMTSKKRSAEAKGNFKKGDIGFIGSIGDYCCYLIHMGKVGLKMPQSSDFVRYNLYLTFHVFPEDAINKIIASNYNNHYLSYLKYTDEMKALNTKLSEAITNKKFDITLDYKEIIDMRIPLFISGNNNRIDMIPCVHYLGFYVQKSPLTVSGLVMKDSVSLMNEPERRSLFNINALVRTFVSGSCQYHGINIEARK